MQDGFGLGQEEASWWQNFTDYNAVPEEWKENLRMNRANIYNLCDMLRPYLTKQVTNLRLPLTVEEQVGTSGNNFIFFGRRRTFQESCQCFWCVTCNCFSNNKTCARLVITNTLGPQYIRLPKNEQDVNFLLFKLG